MSPARLAPLFASLVLACRAAGPTRSPSEAGPSTSVAETSVAETSDVSKSEPAQSEPSQSEPSQSEPAAPPTKAKNPIVHHPDEVCAIVEVEYESTRGCRIDETLPLSGGARVDVVTVSYDAEEFGEAFESHVILQTPERTTSWRLGKTLIMAGEETYHEVDRMQLVGDVVEIDSREVTITYPNTGAYEDEEGDPNESYEETVEFVTRCSIPDSRCSQPRP